MFEELTALDVMDAARWGCRLSHVKNADLRLGSTTPTNWTKGGDDQGALSWEDGGPYVGVRHLRIDTTAEEKAEWQSSKFKVMPSQAYRWGALAKGVCGNQAFMTLRWFSDEAGSEWVSEVNIALEGTFADWTLKDDYCRAPATALSADLIFKIASDQENDIRATMFFLERL